MNKYSIQQILASIWVAFFILNVAMILLPFNRFVYDKCAEDYESRVVVPEQIDTETKENDPVISLGTWTDADKDASVGAVMSGFEKELQYRALSESFTKFFSKDYPLQGYTVSEENVERLNDLKSYYKRAWVFAIIMLGLMIYSFRILSVRRLYMPFIYGGALAAFITSIKAFIMMQSHKPITEAVRNMILYGDYGYFTGDDIVSRMFPPEFARWMALYYIALVLILILVMTLVKVYLGKRGRPHKF